MRASLLLAAACVAACSLTASVTYAGDGVSDYTMGGCDSCGSGCNTGRCHGCRLHLHRGLGCGHGCHGGCFLGRRYEGQDLQFNCGCQGSYNYPVPPQFTYHWPGSTYKLPLMTNYHSPWRFPPLKPYTEEVLVPQGAEYSVEPTLVPVSAYQDLQAPPVRDGQVEPMSSMIDRFFR